MADDSSSGEEDTRQQKSTTNKDKDEEVPTTIADDLVVTKYKMASEITNKILKEVADKCVDGASSMQICEFGDARLVEETSKVYKKEKHMKKGKIPIDKHASTKT